MFGNSYFPQCDQKASLLPKSNNIHDISDNRVRYTTMGIVNMVHPLNAVEDKNRYFVIYDTHEQTLIVFDVRVIYEKYIKHGLEYISTASGKYRLTPKTIQDIVLLHNGH